MNFRLRMSLQTTNILKELQKSTQLTPNVLARLAISLSLIQPELPPEKEIEQNGMEINRHTLTGQHDLMFRCLIAQRHGRRITDKEYFPGLVNRHLDRGAKLLLHEYKYAGNYEKFIKHLVSLRTKDESHDISR